jgi:hypothetical protein
MKKLIQTTVILFLSISLSAQYKKAGFFEKTGRTYELGSQIYMMGKGNGSPIGYKIGFGRDQDGKRFFSSWDLQFIPSHKYSYATTDDNNDPVTVTGKSASIFVYGLNYGIHLLKNEGEEKHMVQPYVALGLNILLSGGIKEENFSPDPYGYPKRQTSDQSLSLGLNGGLGCIVNLSSKWGVKIQGGYTHQLNVSTESWDDEIKPFYVFDSHKYVSLGLRLRIVSE